jgi:hypothetical protein
LLEQRRQPEGRPAAVFLFLGEGANRAAKKLNRQDTETPRRKAKAEIQFRHGSTELGEGRSQSDSHR